MISAFRHPLLLSESTGSTAATGSSCVLVNPFSYWVISPPSGGGRFDCIRPRLVVGPQISLNFTLTLLVSDFRPFKVFVPTPKIRSPILGQRTDVVSFTPVSVPSKVRLFSRRLFLICGHTLLASCGYVILTTFRLVIIRDWVRNLAVSTGLFGYDLFSQGVNLLRLGLALVRPVRELQLSFGPPCILAQEDCSCRL